MRGIKLVQRLFKRRLKRATAGYLKGLSDGSQRHQAQLSQALASVTDIHKMAVLFGTTQWGQRVQLPLDKVIAHALVLGASGAGKSFFALSLLNQLIASPSSTSSVSLGLLDPKGELFEKAILYLYAHLYCLKPTEREAFKKRIVIIDFSNAELITPYNILARREYLADELMVAGRIDTISEQFSGLSEMSVRMKMILKYFFLLLTEFDLPLSFFERLCINPLLLNALVERSRNPQLKDYFLSRFDDESKSTLLALRQRIDALLISEGVRLSLSAPSAPDFAALQDQGSIILINTAGHNITRGISELLQGLILSDIKQSVFRRTNQQQKFIWFFDEAQNLYKTSANREHMVDLLTMARSFGSFFVLLTQSLTSATRDQDILNSILGNVRWIVMLRSTLRDAGLIGPAIPVTGTMLKSRHNPFEPAQPMSESEELKARLNEVTKLPDRTAYCWLKAYLDKAVKITTPLVAAPHEIAGCSREQFDAFMKAERIGQGLSKAEINKTIKGREQSLKEMLRPRRDPAPAAGAAKDAKRKRKQALVQSLEEEYSTKKRTD